MLGPTLVIPTLGRHRQEDPWSNQPSLLGRLQASERPCLKNKTKGRNKNKTVPKEQHPRLSSDLDKHIHTHLNIKALINWAKLTL